LVYKYTSVKTARGSKTTWSLFSLTVLALLYIVVEGRD